jgi:transposase
VVAGAVAGNKKKADQQKATIHRARRSGVLSTADGRAHLGSPWADADPARETHARSPDRAISGITLDGRLFMQVRPDSYNAEAVVGFLRVLLRKLPGKIILIWDGSPIHRAHEIKDFLKRGAAKRLHLEQLPGYAPDLNPDEGIWNYLKRVELGNVCCTDLNDLSTQLIRARERLRHKREIIRSCSRQCGYSV